MASQPAFVPPTINADLLDTQRRLGQIFNQLAAALAAERDFEKKTAINTELAEVNHRITVLGGLLFRQQTAAIAAAAGKVAEAQPEIEAAIARIETINAFLRATTAFLGVVDRLLDTAKKV